MSWTSGALTRGVVPPVRWLAPLVVFGYMAVLSRGGSTAGDWIAAAASSALALAGGRFPRVNAYGQILLLASVQVVAQLGAAAIKDPAGGAAGTASYVSASTAGPVQLMASLALVELAARLPLRHAVLPALALAGVDLARWRTDQSAAGVLLVLYQLTFFVVGPVLLGAYLREILRRYRQARELADGAELRRVQSERAARLGERTALAREMHDIVAHHIASIALRTAVARDTITDDPRVTAVLADVNHAATQALADLRRMISVLRDPAAVRPASAAGFGAGLIEPGDLLDALQAALDDARTSGLIVSSEIDPAIGGLDAVRALAVLRTVQESLTNALKHAGPGTTVSVRLRADPSGRIEIDIRDQGPIPTHPPAPTGISGEGGHGLIGLAERMAMLGGTFDAGRRDVGWCVRARLPANIRAEHGDTSDDASPPSPGATSTGLSLSAAATTSPGAVGPPGNSDRS